MRHQSFVVRLWLDERQQYRGQLVLPQSDERVPFGDLYELVALIEAWMQSPPTKGTARRVPAARDDQQASSE